MAFVSSFTPSLKSTSSVSFASPAVSVTRHVAPTTFVSPVVMKSGTDIKDKVLRENATFKNLEANRLAKEESYFEPQRGFSLNAEKTNGRYAMMGFAIGLVTEIITGKGILAQLDALFEPISKLIQ